jgi:hypothetical protein
MKLQWNLNSIINISGVLIFIAAYFLKYFLLDVSEQMFDIVCYTGIILYCIHRYDLASIFLFCFVSMRIWDEITIDDGVINYIDIVELILLAAATTYNFFRYNKAKDGI